MTFILTSARAAGFFGVLAIIVLSLVPGTYRPHTGLPGVAEHFIAYCSTAFAFALGFRSRASRIVIALVLTLLAGSMEVLQLWVPGRHSAIIDAVFSSLGGLLGIALGGLLLVLAAQGYRKHRHLGESAELVQRVSKWIAYERCPGREAWVILRRSGTSALQPTPEESAQSRRRSHAPQGDMRGDLPPSILQPKRKDYVMTLSSGIVILAGGLAVPLRTTDLANPPSTPQSAGNPKDISSPGNYRQQQMKGTRNA